MQISLFYFNENFHAYGNLHLKFSLQSKIFLNNFVNKAPGPQLKTCVFYILKSLVLHQSLSNDHLLESSFQDDSNEWQFDRVCWRNFEPYLHASLEL